MTFLAFSSLGSLVGLAEALIDLRYRVPAGTVFLYAVLLHEEINEVFLLNGDFIEVVEEVPERKVEVGLEQAEECCPTFFGKEIIDARVVVPEVRQYDGHLARLQFGGWGVLRPLDCCPLQEFAFDAVLGQGDGDTAAVPVDEPLAEVRGHGDINQDIRHSSCVKCTSQRYDFFLVDAREKARIFRGIGRGWTWLDRGARDYLAGGFF